MEKSEFFALKINFNGYTYNQLAVIADVHPDTIIDWFYEEGIVKITDPLELSRRTIIRRFLKEGLTSSEIAIKLGLTTR